MDLSELTKVVVDRLQKLDPDNVSKITGFILLTEPCEQEMIKLAFGPESTLLSKIHEAKIILGFLSPNNTEVSFQNQSVLDPDSIRKFLNLEEKMYSSSSMGNCYYNQDASYNGSLPSRTSRRSPSLPEFPMKACHYFYNGYCKHGENCRYYHGQSFADGYSQAFSSNFNELQSEENGFSSRSLEKLEMEISDLLKSRRGAPVTITLLAMLYYEKYGRSLQVDGYLTESQRHGKAGFSLTKLLARLKNSFVLIERPHGQHSIILAEDAPKYEEYRNGRSEPIVTLTSSYQIYLTFPADSTFNEDDVSSYFKQFGLVKDVRIPSQEKRMYGFVSFLYPETVCEILKKKNIHYICGSRVLVKPYKEKSRVDRAYIGKSKLAMHYPHQYFDLDSELHGIPRKTDSSRMIKLHLEEQQKMIELKRRQLARFNLVQEPLDQQSYFSYGVDNSKLLEDPNHFPLKDHLDLTVDVLNNGLSSNAKTRNTSDNYNDKESGHIELPDNPFAFPPSVESSF